MLESMTAFARQAVELPSGNLTSEIRTVNHRYLDIQIRAPENLRHLEPTLREILRKKLHRGKVECNFYFQPSRARNQLEVNQNVVTQLAAVTSELTTQFNNQSNRDIQINPIDILRWPGVLSSDNVESNDLDSQVTSLFFECLESLITCRKKEGQAIAEYLKERLSQLNKHVDNVSMHFPEALDSLNAKIYARFHDANISLDPNRLEQELVILAQKSDIAEELDRLKTHIAAVEQAVSNHRVGRRLDFLMQELNREANTLGSKALNAAISTASVEMKVLIEQMREQIQNVE